MFVGCCLGARRYIFENLIFKQNDSTTYLCSLVFHMCSMLGAGIILTNRKLTIAKTKAACHMHFQINIAPFLHRRKFSLSASPLRIFQKAIKKTCIEKVFNPRWKTEKEWIIHREPICLCTIRFLFELFKSIMKWMLRVDAAKSNNCKEIKLWKHIPGYG